MMVRAALWTVGGAAAVGVYGLADGAAHPEHVASDEMAYRAVGFAIPSSDGSARSGSGDHASSGHGPSERVHAQRHPHRSGRQAQSGTRTAGADEPLRPGVRTRPVRHRATPHSTTHPTVDRHDRPLRTDGADEPLRPGMRTGPVHRIAPDRKTHPQGKKARLSAIGDSGGSVSDRQFRDNVRRARSGASSPDREADAPVGTRANPGPYVSHTDKGYGRGRNGLYYDPDAANKQLGTVSKVLRARDGELSTGSDARRPIGSVDNPGPYVSSTDKGYGRGKNGLYYDPDAANKQLGNISRVEQARDGALPEGHDADAPVGTDANPGPYVSKTDKGYGRGRNGLYYDPRAANKQLDTISRRTDAENRPGMDVATDPHEESSERRTDKRKSPYDDLLETSNCVGARVPCGPGIKGSGDGLLTGRPDSITCEHGTTHCTATGTDADGNPARPVAFERADAGTPAQIAWNDHTIDNEAEAADIQADLGDYALLGDWTHGAANVLAGLGNTANAKAIVDRREANLELAQRNLAAAAGPENRARAEAVLTRAQNDLDAARQRFEGTSFSVIEDGATAGAPGSNDIRPGKKASKSARRRSGTTTSNRDDLKRYAYTMQDIAHSFHIPVNVAHDVVHDIKADKSVKKTLKSAKRKNPDVYVSKSTGEVYVRRPDGSLVDDSVANIYEFIPREYR